MAKKTAKRAAKKKAGKGKRYSDEVKQQIIAVVHEVNESKGRGGVAAAARQFGVSPLSIGNWLKKNGAGGGTASVRRRGPSSAGGARDRVLSDLIGLNREISKKRGELETLESRFERLKSSL